MKNKNTKIIFGIVGGVVVLGAIAVALIHFWDDIKKLLPCKKVESDFEEFDDIDDEEE